MNMNYDDCFSICGLDDIFLFDDIVIFLLIILLFLLIFGIDKIRGELVDIFDDEMLDFF